MNHGLRGLGSLASLGMLWLGAATVAIAQDGAVLAEESCHMELAL